MPIIIPAGVHVHTLSDRGFLVGIKSSLLCVSALRFRDGEAHAVFLSVLL